MWNFVIFFYLLDSITFRYLYNCIQQSLKIEDSLANFMLQRV
jgi:hypothetical protein